MNCKVDGCDREAHYKAAQLCQKHYFRVWRNGTTETVRKPAKPRQESPQGYQWIYAPTHPLRHASSGYVAEHRAVVYADLGDGPLFCELCGKPLTWKTCHVDHIDNDVRNNARANLRPTCSTCNTQRGIGPAIYWSRTHCVEYGGDAKTPTEWARDPRVSISGRQIVARIKSGMTPEEALFAPKVTHNGKKKVHHGAPRPQQKVTFAGKTLTPHEWAREPGVTVSSVTIRKRLKAGWNVGGALFIPAADFHAPKRKELQKEKA